MEGHNLRFKTHLLALLLCAFSFLSIAFAAEPNEPKHLPVERQEQVVAGDPAPQIKQVCSVIYKGDFAGARELLGGSEKSKSTAISQLTDLISEYEAMEKRRQSARKAAYREQLAELEKLSAKRDSNDVSVLRSSTAAKDENDVNSVMGLAMPNGSDSNNIPEVLSVIVRACEFADEKQKEELLSKPLVKQTIQKAIDKATEYESKGKWLDAYITCYSWLQAIDPNNKAYSDYAERLVAKANVVVSFQDSPCETRTERFKNVKKEIFAWAIASLRVKYVDVIIDYKQMATKAIERCKLLGKLYSMLDTRYSILDENRESKIENRVSAWSSGLAGILDEVESASGGPAGVDYNEFMKVFENVLSLNATTLELPETVLIAHFSEAALAALDPHTVMIWPQQVQEFEKMMTNEFTGIGIEITKQKGLLTVASLLPDTPAYNSGLDAGDMIEKVDGVETKDMTLICTVNKITGPKGTKVTLTIRCAGEEKTRDITITRAKITVPTLRGWKRTEAGKWLYSIDDANKIGYVRITSFSNRTSADLEKVLDELESEGLKGLILDLRFNSGGLLDSATAVADKFLKGGLIVKTQPRGEKIPVWIAAHKKNTHPNYPLVILINSSSASASEIVAGALADKLYNRAILVGERTHGKGSVQGIRQYRGGGAQLKYTMAYYHLPSDQRVESQEAMKKQGRKDWGVGPNVEITLRSDELKKMIEVQRDNCVLVKADHDNTKQELKKYTIEETIDADPQLAVGVLVVKSKLIEEQALSQTPAG